MAMSLNIEKLLRYKIDEYDRLWWPYTDEDCSRLNSSRSIDSKNNDFKPPSVVMETAAQQKNKSTPLSYSFETFNQTDKFYVYMYFAEVEKLQANKFRQFNISLNGQHWSGPHSPVYLEATTVYKTSPLTGEVEYEFLIYKARNSSLPPIINALEVNKVKELPQLETNQDDVDAVKNIKSTYKIKRNWQGDPCAPEAYMWDGLNCSYNDSPRIISMNLSSSGLTGNISLYISNLSMLQFLDFSNNSLVGEVPSFLSKLPLLRVLVGGNPDLCSSFSCDNKNTKVVASVAASVAASFVLITALAVFWYLKRPKQQVALAGKMDGEFSRTNPALESKNRLFTYSEVMRITSNFERILGKGKHGTVYRGYLDDIPVAVKMLSSASIQSYKHFQAELQLICRTGVSTLLLTIPNDEDTNVLTSVARTPGYLDHEYSESKRLSEKTDVYSFGIVLLEMFTDQPAISRTPEKAHNHKDLVERVSSMVAKGDIEKIVDPRLKGEFGIQSVRKAVEIAMACINAAGTGRLTMDEVLMGLNQCLAVEIAQNKDHHEREEKGSIEMSTVNMETDESILLGSW
ncbi:hypothetical protein CRYUN_Cryun37aG0055000 [Craigia yunnanensis]